MVNASETDSPRTQEQESKPVIMSHRFMSAYKNMPRARRELLLVKLQRASDILDNIRARGAQ